MDCNKCVWGTRDGGCASWDCEFIDRAEAVKAWRKMSEANMQLSGKDATSDLIYRQAAIDLLERYAEMLRRVLDDTDVVRNERDKFEWGLGVIESLMSDMKELPSAEPEIKPISYADCSNAMLKMWIDNVLTDGEYNKIMDKLNAKHRGE